MMKQGMIVVAMVAMLGIGMVAGSLLTPAAQAQKPTVAEHPAAVNDTETYTPAYYPPGGYALTVPPRWQIITIMAPDAAAQRLTVLLDSQTGESFYLDFGGARYYWSRIGK